MNISFHSYIYVQIGFCNRTLTSCDRLLAVTIYVTTVPYIRNEVRYKIRGCLINEPAIKIRSMMKNPATVMKVPIPIPAIRRDDDSSFTILFRILIDSMATTFTSVFKCSENVIFKKKQLEMTFF